MHVSKQTPGAILKEYNKMFTYLDHLQGPENNAEYNDVGGIFQRGQRLEFFSLFFFYLFFRYCHRLSTSYREFKKKIVFIKS